jgi:hypothetical protein
MMTRVIGVAGIDARGDIMRRGIAVLLPLLIAFAVASQAAAAPPESRHFHAHLTGDEEVPPRDTRAQGNAIFKLSKDGTELEYKLIVANIENVTQAHIHLAPAGQNGWIVVWLYPEGPPAQLIPGRSSGPLGTGVITADDLVGPLAGGSLEDLTEALRAGNGYVNVHTSQFPPGEIRGQVFCPIP